MKSSFWADQLVLSLVKELSLIYKILCTFKDKHFTLYVHCLLDTIQCGTSNAFLQYFCNIFIINIMTYFIDNWQILTKNVYFIFQVSERFYMLISSSKPSGKFTEM